MVDSENIETWGTVTRPGDEQFLEGMDKRFYEWASELRRRNGYAVSDYLEYERRLFKRYG